ncbi:acetyl-CoA carboxylase biotin carboxyl carrier protein subunit [Candidatus Babeliales bacterium]|nr:acetyl-CoA carboxylase biotin carboxyl carrier protein subunit [Candidatus Babeliales bacterium]
MEIKNFWIKSKKHSIKINKNENDYFSIEIDQKKINAKIIKKNTYQNAIFLLINNIIYKAKILEENNKHTIIYIFNFNKTFTINFEQPKIINTKSKNISQQQDFKNTLKSPIAGKVIKINVKPNQFIKKNQTLIVIESMKMENEIRTINDVFIKNILICESDLVKTNQILMTFAKKGDTNAKSKNKNE